MCKMFFAPIAFLGCAIAVQVQESLIKHSNSSLNIARLNACGARLSFGDFHAKFGRAYDRDSKEYSHRKDIFEKFAQQVADLNCGSEARSWTAGINDLADWTDDELSNLRGYVPGYSAAGSLSKKPPLQPRVQHESLSLAAINTTRDILPASFSWGHLRALQTATNQGRCGSCWAITAETTVRSHAEIRRLQLPSISVDELVDCTPNPNHCGGFGGCKGATSELAFQYMVESSMLTSPNRFLSKSQYGACTRSRVQVGDSVLKSSLLEDGGQMFQVDGALPAEAGMSGWKKFPENKMLPLLRGLVELGPVAVTVASGWNWHYYKSGVLNQDLFDKRLLDHAVVLFGYGADNGRKYWHLKNSWGQSWGESGNLRLRRLDKEEEACGWDRHPQRGTGCDGGPRRVWVCGSQGILYDAAVPLFGATTSAKQ